MHFKVGPFEIGSNTFWIGFHGILMLLIFGCLLYLFAAIIFSKKADKKVITNLKAAALISFVALVLLMVTGLIPDIGFGNTNTFSGTFQNDFGTVHAVVTYRQLDALTGPLLFDMMEHISFIVPGLAALFCFLVFHYGAQVVENRSIRVAALWVLVLTVGWVFVIGNIGLYVTKVLTYPYTR